MSPFDNFVMHLDDRVKLRKSGRGYICCCPAHDDKSPSLSVSEGDDGRVLVYCHAGCTPREIAESVGLRIQDLFPPQTPEQAKVWMAKRDEKQKLADRQLVVIAEDLIGQGKALDPIDQEVYGKAKARLAND